MIAKLRYLVVPILLSSAKVCCPITWQFTVTHLGPGSKLRGYATAAIPKRTCMKKILPTLTFRQEVPNNEQTHNGKDKDTA